ncbi:MAG: AAA family ATPase [Muribaculaceae bacterium]|nr:AAA family ATPase [Muribaculaceae bacterium]
MKKDDFQALCDAIDSVTLPDGIFDEPTPYVYEDDDNGVMDIISALDKVVTGAKHSGLVRKYWDEYAAEFDFLSKRLELSSRETLIVGILGELGRTVSWGHLGQFLGLSRLRSMSLSADMDNLKVKRWIRPYAMREGIEKTTGFRLAAGVLESLRNDRKFIPENLVCKDEQSFVDRLCRFYKKEGADEKYPLEEKLQWLDEFCLVNIHLPLCAAYSNLTDKASKILLMLSINDYANYAEQPGEGLIEGEIEDWFDDVLETEIVVSELKSGMQELFKLDFFEFGTEDGLADTDRWKLTGKAREELLGEYTPKASRSNALGKKTDRDLRSHKSIMEKDLYYNAKELGQINRIADIISREGFDKVKARLSDSGFRCGICCLLYGAPGTGKTETVLQLARRTGRDIFQVNISGLRDKYVGESEKNIKMVFERYKKLCLGSEHIPILLFNEADAIFGRRFENLRSSVEKMDNAIQNIILQEMETFEGILIATTNLTDNLDSAFDRRFLFKVEFTNPGVKARTKIWHSMLPEIDKEECATFAKEFNMSGGQIENVARKCKIEYVATGVYPDKDKVKSFCKEEYLTRRNTHRRIGFCM